MAIQPDQLTYIWSDDWQKLTDGSSKYSGGCFFFIGKRTTISALGLDTGKNYKFTFHLAYTHNDPIQVTVMVKCGNNYKSKTATISKSDDILNISTDYIQVLNNYDVIEFAIFTNEVKDMNAIIIKRVVSNPAI